MHGVQKAHTNALSSSTATPATTVATTETRHLFAGRQAELLNTQDTTKSLVSGAQKSPQSMLLKFRINQELYEELRSMGLSVKVVPGDFARSYLLAESSSDKRFNYAPWIKDVAETAKYVPESTFYSIPYHIVEISLESKDAFHSHLASAGKADKPLGQLSNGSVLGFLTLSEHHNDPKWIDVREVFVPVQAQSLGIGSLLMRCASAIGFYNNKRGIEYDNITSLDSQSFYKAKGLTIIEQ